MKCIRSCCKEHVDYWENKYKQKDLTLKELKEWCEKRKCRSCELIYLCRHIDEPKNMDIEAITKVVRDD